MHVLIITDIEGVSSVDSIDVIDESSEAYKKGQELLMADTNAAVAGALAGGADEVWVFDGHCRGTNFIKEKLDPRVKQISVEEFVRTAFEKADAVISIGCHAMAGAEKAFLDHTQSSLRWFEYKVGGKCYGEIGQQAICGGAFSVPLVMVSGDEAACNEAKELIPNIAVAQVKTADIRNKAVCIPQEEALKLIYNAAVDGVSRYKEIKPYNIELPTEISVTYCRNDYCDEAVEALGSSVTRKGRTVSVKLDKITCYSDLTKY